MNRAIGNILKNMMKNLLLPLIFSLLLSSCVDRKIKGGFNDNITNLNQFHDDYSQVEEELDLVENNKEKLCFRASLNTQEVSPRLLGKLLSEVYGRNIHTDPAFNDNDILISFNMYEVCIKDVLEHLTEVYDIGYIESNSGYNIYPPIIKTRTFPISYHNFNRQGASSMSVRGSHLTNNADSLNDGSGFAAISTKSEEAFWTNIESSLRLIVFENSLTNDKLVKKQDATDRSSGQISVYKESGLVIVKAYPRDMRAAEDFLNKVNKNSIRQVVIEAKILEITLDDDFSSGVQWDLLRKSLHLTSFPASMANSVISNPINQGSSSRVASLINNNPVSTFMRGGITNRTDFKAVLQALSAQGKLSVLSSPRISTLNNQRALIKYGEDSYFITNVSSSSSPISTGTTNSAATTSSFNMTPFFSGVALDATPNVMSDDELVMHIHPMITRVEQQIINVTLSGQNTSLPAAQIFSREADTVVKARSGDIIILGGMAQNNVTVNSSGLPVDTLKTPGLSNLLSSIFGSKQYSSKKTELIILLKPTIVKKFDVHSDKEFSKYILPD